MLSASCTMSGRERDIAPDALPLPQETLFPESPQVTPTPEAELQSLLPPPSPMPHVTQVAHSVAAQLHLPW